MVNSLGIIELLKENTRPLHAQLDHHPLLINLIGEKLNVGQYVKILGLFYGFFAPVEKSLNILPSEQKSDWISQDLAWFGIDASTLTWCELIPRANSPARAAGITYVLEGSTLGGKIISQRIEASLGVKPSGGGRFFHNYGDNSKLHWKKQKL
jgi:heme oxygenase